MTTLIEIDDLYCEFPIGSPLWARIRRRQPNALRAVDHVSLQIEAGTSVGVVGESGCGKSTLAKAVIGLVRPTSGSILLDGIELTGHRDRATRRRIQMVFQDPGSSLNPRMTVGDAIAEMLHVHGLRTGAGVEQRCRELLELVELPATAYDQRPQAMSGGQRQRVAIARALAVEPDLLIADEAVAALDVSVQASVLNLLNDLRQRLGLTMLFISHDLGVVRQVTDRVVVLYLGRVVEDQPTNDVFDRPIHPYTKALLAAAPRLGATKRPGDQALQGEVPSALERHTGCAFRPRCPVAVERCASEAPLLSGSDQTHTAACHVARIGIAID
jgi:oligopeptide/dipeptide ABC transporter ATP-binding protein